VSEKNIDKREIRGLKWEQVRNLCKWGWEQKLKRKIKGEELN